MFGCASLVGDGWPATCQPERAECSRSPYATCERLLPKLNPKGERDHVGRPSRHVAGLSLSPLRNSPHVWSGAAPPRRFREAPRRTLCLILRQLRVMQREDPIRNACIRVLAIFRRVGEEATMDEQSRAPLVRASRTILCHAPG